MSHTLIEGLLAIAGRDHRFAASADVVHVVLCGTLLGHHRRGALSPRSAVWRTIPSVSRVTAVPERLGATFLDTASGATVVIPLTEVDIRRCPPKGRRLARFLEPTGFSGPCNVNFKRADDGRIVVFEINPRFGGSLMRPANRGDLAETLAVIVARARERAENTPAPISRDVQPDAAFSPR